MKHALVAATCFASLAFAPAVLGFASGPGTCVAEASAITGMQSRPRNNPGEGPFQVMFDMGGNTYTPGQVHIITIMSSNASTFAGYMIYGETQMGMRVGAFDKTDAEVGSPLATCPDSPDATASHASAGPVATTDIMIPWTAPATDVGDITLRSVVLGGDRTSIGNAGQEFFFPLNVTLTPAGPADEVFADGFETAPPGQR